MTRRIMIKRKPPTPAVAPPVTVPVVNVPATIPTTLGIDLGSGPDRTVIRRFDGTGLAEGGAIPVRGYADSVTYTTQARGVTLMVGECSLDYDMLRRILLCYFPIRLNGNAQSLDVSITDDLLRELRGPTPEDSMYTIRRLVETAIVRMVTGHVAPLVMEDVARKIGEFHRRGRV